MPFTVITIKKVPPSLRGDLTKWMQEINTGVYVGNFNSRIREYLWKRVGEQIGSGEAAMSYACRNEIGYDFKTLNTERHVIDFDGLPLMMYQEATTDTAAIEKGFSNAYKMHIARMTHKSGKNTSNSNEKTVHATVKTETAPYVVIDVETTGLNIEYDHIIEIGAVKKLGEEVHEFHRLIRIDSVLPEKIIQLTGITNDMLQSGVSLRIALDGFLDFIGEYRLVGYNISFDIEFLNAGLKRFGQSAITNPVFDLLKVVRTEKMFQENYRLETSLKAYGIDKKLPHRALDDARLIFELSQKVNKKM